MDTLEIDELKAGPELDKLVAEKVFGWVGLHWEKAESGYNSFPTNWNDPISWYKCEGFYGKGPNGECYLTKAYSTRMSDAMELINKVKEGRDLFIEWWNDGEWFIAAHPVGYRDDGKFARSDEFDTDTGDPSLPLAVCRYTLKLMAKEEEEWKRYHPEEGESNE